MHVELSRVAERQPTHRRADADRARVFLAVDLPAAIKDLIGSELRAVRRLARDCRLKLTWINEDSLHLTLAFVASVDPSGLDDISSVMTSVAKDTRHFDLGLGGGGAFPSLREPSILWIGVTHGAQALTALAQETQSGVASIGYPQAPRPFTPHLTIARSRRTQDVGAVVAAASALALPPFQVSEVVLFRSHLSANQPHYERIAGYALSPTR